MVLLTQKGSDMGIVLVSLRGIVLKPSWIWKSWNIDLDIISASGQLSCIWGEMTPWSGTLVSFVPFSFRLWTLFFHSFCNLLINKGVKRSRFARYDSMQHHVYASHMYTYIRYRYRFFLWTLSFLKIWIHFLIPDVHLCNTSYYVGFESCSYTVLVPAITDFSPFTLQLC